MATIFGAAAASGASTAATTAAATTATAGFTGAAVHAGAGAATTSLISAGTAANVAAGLSVLALVRQGQAAKINSEQQAERIKRDATNREVDRRRRLVASLASQNATRAASGIAFLEGSSKNIALEDIRSGEGSFLVGRAGAADAASSIIGAGRAARDTSLINAAATGLDQIDRVRTRG